MRTALAENPKEVLSPPIVILNGHAAARIIREADKDGLSVEHQLVATGRYVDKLFELGLDATRHQAATMLRDDYERGAPSMGVLPCRDLDAPLGSGSERDLVSNEEAWKRYIRASKQLGQWWPIIRHVVIEDGSPQEFGRKWRCNGQIMLEIGLDRLVVHFGLATR